MDIAIYAERALEKERALRGSCLQDLTPLSDKQLDLAQCLQLVDDFCCYFDALREVVQKRADCFGERNNQKLNPFLRKEILRYSLLRTQYAIILLIPIILVSIVMINNACLRT